MLKAAAEIDRPPQERLLLDKSSRFEYAIQKLTVNLFFRHDSWWSVRSTRDTIGIPQKSAFVFPRSIEGR